MKHAHSTNNRLDHDRGIEDVGFSGRNGRALCSTKGLHDIPIYNRVISSKTIAPRGSRTRFAHEAKVSSLFYSLAVLLNIIEEQPWFCKYIFSQITSKTVPHANCIRFMALNFSYFKHTRRFNCSLSSH